MDMSAVILVVDDEKAIRISLRKALEACGHEVVVAEDAEEGMKKVEECVLS